MTIQQRTVAVTRRSFLRTTGAAVAVPMIVPASVLGKGDTVAPSERVTMACVGVGGRGTGNLAAFAAQAGTEVVAVCDVDAAHRRSALERLGLAREAGYDDFRELLERADIDTVMVGTPDHWHALITLAALRAGKDVYCEKPLAASVAEGKAVVEAVRTTGRIVQCGTQRRSRAGCRRACELVRNGRIGKLEKIEVGVPGTFAIRGGYTGQEKPEAVPEGLDYELWQGPAPERPYTAARCHFNFRWVLDYAPGYITDWGAHYLDVAQWGNGSDRSGPVKVAAARVRTREDSLYDAPEGYEITYTYANGVRAVMLTTDDTTRWGMRFVGSDGSLYVETDKVVTEPAGIAESVIDDDEIRLYASDNHHANFIECVRKRSEPAAPAEVGHRSASLCHIGAVACVVGRELRWDPSKERFVDDDEANRVLARPLRAPWKL